MILWRISNRADLTGTGGIYASARWNTRGRPVIYLAESPSAALLETLVHLELSEEDRPNTYQLLKIEAANDLPLEEIELTSLPENWTKRPELTQSLGDAWLISGETTLLRVPSAITPETWNWLLNPRQEAASRVRILRADTHLFDSRLVSKCAALLKRKFRPYVGPSGTCLSLRRSYRFGSASRARNAERVRSRISH